MKSKLNFILNKDCDIIALSETKFHDHSKLPAMTNFLASHPAGPFKFIMNSTKTARGCAIIFRSKLNMQIHRSILDPEENFLLLDVTINDSQLTIGAVYAPSDNQIGLFESLRTNIETIGNQHFWIAGDFNCTPSNLEPNLNPDLENHNGCPLSGSDFISNWSATTGCFEPFRYLFPDNKDFSYRRRVGNSISKSRIDFHIMSNSFANSLFDAAYIPTPRPAFDHYFAIATTKHRSKNTSTMHISSEACNSPHLQRLAALATINLIPEYSSAIIPPSFSAIAARLNLYNLQILGIDDHLADTYDHMLYLMGDRLQTSFEQDFSTITQMQIFQRPELNIPPPTCLQVLLNDLKLQASHLSYRLKKRKNAYINSLQLELRTIKLSAPNDIATINDLEEKLQAELKANFESTEIGTGDDPSLISRALNAKYGTPTSVIRDDNGQQFKSSHERTNHVVNFFSSIYSVNQPSNLSVSQFLGNDNPSSGMDHQTNSTLTRPFTDNEILKMINSVGSKVATGPDKIPSLLLKKTARFFINLITLAFNSVFVGTEHFPADFKLCRITLIPKKSSPLNVRNWRPISIGNSIYKIYTKFIGKRLATALPSFIGAEQKAYLKTVNISEATCNVIEYLNHLNKITNNPAIGDKLVVAVDWKKAFDSVSHDFIIKALEHFNFSNHFINIITKWLSNRKSCIVVDGFPSEYFDIRRGIPQGDAVSGYIFIIVMEILILRLRTTTHANPKLSLPLGTNFLASDVYADDLITIINGTHASISEFKLIINTYTQCSGLHMNTDKTEVMAIGPNEPEMRRLIDGHGFRFVTNIKHLGFDIDSKLKNLGLNWDQKIAKMSHIKNMLSTFALPLASKINVTKCFLLSQICYLAPILEPTSTQISAIEKTILKFLYPRQASFSAVRTFATIESGGLGIPNISFFLKCMRIKFALRASKSLQPWALELRKKFPLGNITFFSPLTHTQNDSFFNHFNNCTEFQQTYYNHKDRCWSAPAFFSIFSNRNNPPFDLMNPPAQVDNILNVKLLDLIKLPEMRLKSYGELLRSYRCTFNVFFHLRMAAADAYSRWAPASNQSACKDLGWFASKNPSTKKIRAIATNINPAFNCFSLPSTTHFATCGNFDLANSDIKNRFLKYYNTWNTSFLTPELKTFALKFCSNKLLFNYTRSRWENINPFCTFCRRYNVQNPPPETVSHVFCECPFVVNTINKILVPICNNTQTPKCLIFCGAPKSNLQSFFNIEIIATLFFIYKAKLSTGLISFASLKQNINFEREFMSKKSKTYKEMKSAAINLLGQDYANSF